MMAVTLFNDLINEPSIALGVKTSTTFVNYLVEHILMYFNE